MVVFTIFCVNIVWFDRMVSLKNLSTSGATNVSLCQFGIFYESKNKEILLRDADII